MSEVPDRIETAIVRLTEIASDLRSMIAVQESRLTQQEKQSEHIQDVVEKRREEVEGSFKEIYNIIEEQDERTREKIEQVEKRTVRLEKYLWLAIGGGTVITWLIINHGAVIDTAKLLVK